jgi:hypothetical protein
VPRQQKQHGAAWRRRREEYLRSSGRRADLVKEGYEAAGSMTSWTVIVGDRRSRCPRPRARGGLFFVKGVAS